MKTIPANPVTRVFLAVTLVYALLAIASPISLARALPQAASEPAEPSAQTTSPFGAALYGTNRIDDTQMPPTKVSLIGYRHLALKYALDGYRRSKVPLVAFDGAMYLKAGFADDPGLYYFVPQLAARTGLSLEHAIDLFFGAILAVSFLVGIAGFLISLDGWPLKLWATFGLCLLLWFSYKKGDVYLVLSAPVIAFVPWLLYLLKKNAAGAAMSIFLFGTGLVAGFANEIRGYAATALLIFAAILVAFELRRGLARKFLLLAALFAGFVVSVLYFSTLLARRDAFLVAAQPGYTQTVDHHSVWHSMYIGLGFIRNPYVAGYRDEVAAQAVHDISPSTPALSPEYERILRNETLRIAREHPWFIVATLLAKLRIILFLLLSWANFGLLAAALRPKGWAMESAFWMALAFTSLFGIIAIPQVQYLLGFMAFSAVYGIASLDWALSQRGANAPH